MKPISKILLSVALVLIVMIAAVVVLHQPAVDDRVQIGNQLEAARAAGERHRHGSAVRSRCSSSDRSASCLVLDLS